MTRCGLYDTIFRILGRLCPPRIRQCCVPCPPNQSPLRILIWRIGSAESWRTVHLKVRQNYPPRTKSASVRRGQCGLLWRDLSATITGLCHDVSGTIPDGLFLPHIRPRQCPQASAADFKLADIDGLGPAQYPADLIRGRSASVRLSSPRIPPRILNWRTMADSCGLSGGLWRIHLADGPPKFWSATASWQNFCLADIVRRGQCPQWKKV